jgi:hypothetical protein
MPHIPDEIKQPTSPRPPGAPEVAIGQPQPQTADFSILGSLSRLWQPCTLAL